MEYDLEPYGKEEHQECIVIANADTVIDPGAVVVKSFHAHVAGVAVARTGSSDN